MAVKLNYKLIKFKPFVRMLSEDHNPKRLFFFLTGKNGKKVSSKTAKKYIFRKFKKMRTAVENIHAQDMLGIKTVNYADRVEKIRQFRVKLGADFSIRNMLLKNKNKITPKVREYFIHNLKNKPSFGKGGISAYNRFFDKYKHLMRENRHSRIRLVK